MKTNKKFGLNFTKIALVMSFAITAAAGCQTTTHTPRSFNDLGQFSVYPLNKNTYRVSFKGSSSLSYGTAEEVALLKSAQATVSKGFKYFQVKDDPSNRSAERQPRQAMVYPSSHFSNFRPLGFSRYHRYDPFFDAPYVVNIEPTEVTYTIQCFKADMKQPEQAFDAHLILSSIGQKYGLDRDGHVIQPPTPPTHRRQ